MKLLLIAPIDISVKSKRFYFFISEGIYTFFLFISYHPEQWKSCWQNGVPAKCDLQENS